MNVNFRGCGILSLFKTVYTALRHEDYFRVANALGNEGLKYKVKRSSQKNAGLGEHFSGSNLNAQVTYDFYVQKGDQYKTEKILSALA